VAQQARDRGGPEIAYQLLIYPATDLTMAEPSHQELAEGYRLTKPLMEWFVNHYLNNYAERSDPRASPLLNADLHGLPPALVITAGFDPLRDEGVHYADKLAAAGVETAHVCYDGMIHGFFSMGGWLEKSREALDYVAERLGEALTKA
jgi:acetyl esterase